MSMKSRERERLLLGHADPDEAMFQHRRAAEALLTSGDVSEDFYEDDLESAASIQQSMPFADDLTQKAQIRDGKHEKLNEEAPFVRNNPVSVLKGTLGGQQVVSSDFDAPNNSQVALWQGDDAETCPVNVTFAPVQQLVTVAAGSGLAANALRPYGIVKFGTRAMTVDVEVDILKGCQFTVGASLVALQVALDKVPQGSTGATMKLMGMLSFHAPQRTTDITRTKYVDNLTAATQENIVIPPFAKTVQVLHGDPTQVVFVGFIDANDVTVVLLTFVAGVVMQPVLIPGDAVQIYVYCAGGANSFRAIFGLSL